MFFIHVCENAEVFCVYVRKKKNDAKDKKKYN